MANKKTSAKAADTPKTDKKTPKKTSTKTSKKVSKKASTKNGKIVLGTVAIVAAAVLIFAVASILRGCAAESMKQSSKGVTMEIVDVSVANDFLYLTVNETYNRKLLTAQEEADRYALPTLNYSGSVTAANGEAIEFDSRNFLYLQYENSDYGDCGFNDKDKTVTIAKDWYKRNSKFTANVKYKVYVPDMIVLVQENKGAYYCTLQVTGEETGSKMNFRFTIDDMSDVKATQVRYMGNRVDVDELPFIFHEMQISPTCIDLLIGWNTPPENPDYRPDAWAQVVLAADAEDTDAVTLGSCLEKALPEGSTTQLSSYVMLQERCFLVLSYYQPDKAYAENDIKLTIKDIHCDYSGLIANRNEWKKDIVFKAKKAGDEKVTLSTKLSLGDVQIQLNGARLLHPERDITSYYTYSSVEFDGSISYSGEGELTHWRGYMDLYNPTTNETARFSICYYDMTKEEVRMYDVNNGLEIGSYYLDAPAEFFENLSQWHIVGVTECRRIIRADGVVSDDLYYQNRWNNPKFADTALDFVTFRGKSTMVNQYVA